MGLVWGLCSLPGARHHRWNYIWGPGALSQWCWEWPQQLQDGIPGWFPIGKRHRAPLVPHNTNP